jgi:cell division protein FtsI/penicillin-binding protein 2
MKKRSYRIKYRNNSFTKKQSQIEKRYKILIVFIIALLSILLGYLYYVQIVKCDFFKEKVESSTVKIVLGDSAPRGRIYDRNGKLIVDNIAVKTIVYKKTGLSSKEEIDLAYKVGSLIDVNYSKLSDNDLRIFWIKNNQNEASNLITAQEYDDLEERKIGSDDIEKFKIERVPKDEIGKYHSSDREAAYIYKLMNDGYNYAEKVIKKDDVTDLEYAVIAENLSSLPGFNIKLDWERQYLYGDVFRTILGTVSSSENGIPYELKNYYLNKGYALNDRVGTSYLEYQYEDILRGVKNKYQVIDGKYILLEEGRRGNDIQLSIDIDLQSKVEKILEEELLATKSEPNTKFYNKSFVIISDPNSGEILAMAGKQISESMGQYKFYDYTPGVITTPVVVGSVVKGASHIVGYNTGNLSIGEVRDDACLKIASTKEKCSWKYLGVLDDISALQFSSNTYQYNTAIRVGNGIYSYDAPLVIDDKAFDIYRDTFAQFGLGVKTEIDLPLESLGYKGSSTLPGHLMDFSIGQYDTYTPIQLSQYINTIANGGKRLKPRLLKSIYNPTKQGLNDKMRDIDTVILNSVNTNSEYMDRVRLGFRKVMDSGTGYGYIDLSYMPAGKTGTSESFIDTNGDNVVDTETITNTFVAYAPYDNPRVSFTVISPDIYFNESGSTYQSNVNKRIVSRVSKKYFDFYK